MPSASAFLAEAESGPQRDRDVLHAAVAHVEEMGVALAAVADDGDLLALDQIEVGIPVVIDAHVLSWSCASNAASRKHGRSGVAGPAGVSSECGGAIKRSPRLGPARLAPRRGLSRPVA